MKQSVWLLGSLLILSIGARAVDSWPSFRGPNSSGVSESARPPIKFGTNENVAWKIAVPGSPSSPCVSSDRIFLTVFAGGKLQTHCYRARDGKLLWSRDAEAKKLEEFHATEGSPAASTPATDGK